MPSIIYQAQNLIETMSPGKFGYFATGSAASFLIYALITVIHRLYFSSLAGFPGPKIAAATGWYEFYFDIIKRGKYIYEIEKMHHKYGNQRNTIRATLSNLSNFLRADYPNQPVRAGHSRS